MNTKNYLGVVLTETRVDGLVNNSMLIKVTSDVSILTNLGDTPCLIVGWGLLNRIYPNTEFSIISKKVSNNIFWTFSRNENRSEQEVDLSRFYTILMENISVRYTFIDVLTSSYSTSKKLLSMLSDQTPNYIYFSGESFCYIYTNNHIYGICLYDLEFIGIDRDKIIKFISKNRNNHIIYSDFFIPLNIKNIMSHKQFLVPYLYSIKDLI